MSKTKIRSAKDILKLGNIMAVWAHPDDETYLCGGIMATAIANGQEVVCVTATKGEAGVQDQSRWPANKLAQIRAAELNDALKILGVDNHFWLDYQDGCCCDIDQYEAGDKLNLLINRFKPNSILTFGPDGLTGHLDHQTVSGWVDYALAGRNDIKVYHAVEENQLFEEFLADADRQFNIYFNIDRPPLYDIDQCDIGYKLDSRLFQQKYQALAAMPSQTEAMFQQLPQDTIKALIGWECFVLAEKLD